MVDNGDLFIKIVKLENFEYCLSWKIKEKWGISWTKLFSAILNIDKLEVMF